MIPKVFWQRQENILCQIATIKVATNGWIKYGCSLWGDKEH